jgi:hypothetical protein
MTGHQEANFRHQTSSSKWLKKVAIKQHTSYTAHKMNLMRKMMTMSLKPPPGSENAQLFLSCGLDSLKIEKW